MSGYEIIDLHTHTFPDKIASKAVGRLKGASHTVPFSDGTNEGLLKTQKQAGISLSVILPVATSPSQVGSINRHAAETNREYVGRGLFSLGAMHPLYEDWYDELSRIKDAGLKGFKIHPVYQGVDIDDPVFLKILKRAADLDLVVVTHAGLDIGSPGVVRCSPQMCRHVIEETGRFRFVLAHMGGWKNWDEVPDTFRDTGVYADTSFSSGSFHRIDSYWTEEDAKMLDADGFMKIIRALGTDHILFGTDSPWSDQKETVQFVSGLPLSEKEKHMIFAGNAERVLSL